MKQGARYNIMYISFLKVSYIFVIIMKVIHTHSRKLRHRQLQRNKHTKHPEPPQKFLFRNTPCPRCSWAGTGEVRKGVIVTNGTVARRQCWADAEKGQGGAITLGERGWGKSHPRSNVWVHLKYEFAHCKVGGLMKNSKPLAGRRQLNCLRVSIKEFISPRTPTKQ